MKEQSGVQDPKPDHEVAGRRSTIYNLFVLALILFSWVVMAGVLFGPHIDEIVWRGDFFVCMVLFVGFRRNLSRAPSRADYFFKVGGWLDLFAVLTSFGSETGGFAVRTARHDRLDQRGQRGDPRRAGRGKGAIAAAARGLAVLGRLNHWQ